MTNINTAKCKEAYLEHLKSHFSDSDPIKRVDIKAFNDANSYKNISWFYNDSKYKVGRGLYSLSQISIEPNTVETQPASKKPADTSTTEATLFAKSVSSNEELVPRVDPLFVKHGEFNLISKIIESKKFYPIFVTGLSGNGKTFSIEQACAKSNREMYRVNITIETDEDDLLGGFRLVNDCTKWFDGPVIRAMKSGGVLLLDEVDLGSNKLLCLQPILEGKGILLKKINQYVVPAKGFTIVATANTKGQGSESGKFIGTNILNEAFLERFCATFEQEYPSESVETKILSGVFASNDLSGEHIDDFVLKLVTWASATRKTYDNGGTSDLISTRRLVHIANAYSIVESGKLDTKSIGKDRRQAIQMCISRFDDATKESFINFYSAIDPYLNGNLDESVEQESVETIADSLDKVL